MSCYRKVIDSIIFNNEYKNKVIEDLFLIDKFFETKKQLTKRLPYSEFIQILS
jgi:hypothetical protein